MRAHESDTFSSVLAAAAAAASSSYYYWSKLFFWLLLPLLQQVPLDAATSGKHKMMQQLLTAVDSVRRNDKCQFQPAVRQLRDEKNERLLASVGLLCCCVVFCALLPLGFPQIFQKREKTFLLYYFIFF